MTNNRGYRASVTDPVSLPFQAIAEGGEEPVEEE